MDLQEKDNEIYHLRMQLEEHQGQAEKIDILNMEIRRLNGTV